MFVGFLLFITMVIIISLVIRKHKVKRQVLFEQLLNKNSQMYKVK